MKDLRGAWPARGWSWDGRLMCITSSFSADLEAQARAAVATALANEWTSATIHGAPLALRDIVERVGGVRAGQLVLARPAVSGPFVYGLWWPWGDELTISLRIGLGGPGATEDAFQRLRDAFGVEL
jgi:hypothetical protein